MKMVMDLLIAGLLLYGTLSVFGGYAFYRIMLRS